jgi:hypothetical protein
LRLRRCCGCRRRDRPVFGEDYRVGDDHSLSQEASFDAELTGIMGSAFDIVRREMHDRGQPDVVLEVLAKAIIEIARNGERDAARIAERALEKVGVRRAD